MYLQLATRFLNATSLAVLLMLLGAWYITFASKMMRSKDLIHYKKALRLNVYAIGVYWAIGVAIIIQNDMNGSMTIQLVPSGRIAKQMGQLLFIRDQKSR